MPLSGRRTCRREGRRTVSECQPARALFGVIFRVPRAVGGTSGCATGSWPACGSGRWWRPLGTALSSLADGGFGVRFVDAPRETRSDEGHHVDVVHPVVLLRTTCRSWPWSTKVDPSGDPGPKSSGVLQSYVVDAQRA